MAKDNDVAANVIAGGIIGLGAMAMLGGLLVSGALLKAFVMRQLWAWFLQPGFGLATPSYPVAVGVSLIVSLLVWRGNVTLTQEVPKGMPPGLVLKPSARVTDAYVGWAFLLLTGWIFHFFV